MAYSQYIATNEWQPISTAGQSGSCWLKPTPDGNGNDSICIVAHAASIPDADYNIGMQVFKPKANNDVIGFTSDSTSDIAFVRTLAPGKIAYLIADMV